MSSKAEKTLFRGDLDVPLINHQVANDYRLRCLVPTLLKYSNQSVKLLIIGHLGRPTQRNSEDSLIPVKNKLERLIHQPITFISQLKEIGDWQKNGSRLALLENLRFFPGENNKDRGFAQKLCQGFQQYIFEAFAHYRPSASIQIIPEILPTVSGDRFNLEVKTLKKVVEDGNNPRLLIISGAKEDKFKIIKKLKNKYDLTIIAGRLALLGLPSYLRNNPRIKNSTLTPNGLDIDANAITFIKNHITLAKTVVLNGPLGRFEDEINSKGTKEIFRNLKNSPAFTLLGGGDTINAIKALDFKYSDFSFVSTGGGAMLDFLISGTHPLLEAKGSSEPSAVRNEV